MRLAVDRRRGRTGEIKVEHVPDVDVRYAQMHRDDLDKAICGIDIKKTSFPRDFNLRPSAVIGLKCPVSGKLNKPTFMPTSFVDVPSAHVNRRPASVN